MKQILEMELSRYLNVSGVAIFGSGKVSVYHLLKALRKKNGRDVVLVSAFTCPDIPAAAVRAGFRVYPLDVHEKTLDLDPRLFPEIRGDEIAAVILSNLYGLPDAIEPWMKLSRKFGFVVIDDASQAILSEIQGTIVGCRGHYGILSFGRGKAIHAFGGGAVVFPHLQAFLPGGSGEEPLVVKEDLSHLDVCGSSGSLSRGVGEAGRFLKECSLSIASWIGEHPTMYTLVSRLPFLRLGEVRYKETFPLGGMSLMRMLGVLAHLSRKKLVQSTFLRRTLWWHRGLSESQSGIIEPSTARGFSFNNASGPDQVVPIRYPILFKNSAQREKAWTVFSRQGLGASTSYNKALDGFSELRPKLLDHNFPIARDIASRLITLPVHCYVQRDDCEKVLRAIKEGVQGAKSETIPDTY